MRDARSMRDATRDTAARFMRDAKSDEAAMQDDLRQREAAMM